MSKLIAALLLFVSSSAMAATTVCTAYCMKSQNKVIERTLRASTILGAGRSREEAVLDLRTKCPAPDSKGRQEKGWVLRSQLVLHVEGTLGYGEAVFGAAGESDFACIEI